MSETATEAVIKTLEWDERSGSHYADTALGECVIDQDGDGFYVIENGRKHSDFASLEDAKTFVQRNHDTWVGDWLSPLGSAAPSMYAALEAMLVNPDKASREQARAALNRANNR